MLWIPLTSLTLALNRMGGASISEEITKSVKSRDAFYMQSLETGLSVVVQLFHEFAVDEDLLELGISEEHMEPSNFTDKVKAIQRRLQLLKGSSPYVSEATVFLPLMNRTITTTDYQTSLTSEVYDMLKGNFNPSRLIMHDGRLFMSTRFPGHLISEREPVFVIAVELSQSVIQHTLRNIVSQEQGNSVLLGLDDDWSISNERDEELLQRLKVVIDSQEEEGLAQASGMLPLELDRTTYMVSYTTSDLLGASLLVYVLEEKIIGSLKSYERWTWGLLVFSVVIIFLLAYSLYRIIHHPLRKLVSAFRRVEDGKLLTIDVDARRDEFNYLYHRFNSMVSKLDVLIHEVYEKEIRNQRSELKQLQSQINPHFLYNCFFSLNRLIKECNNEEAYQFVLYLGNYFRFITRDMADQIPLAKEMEHARAYVQIHSVLYGPYVDIEFEPLDEAYNDLSVPRLIVQPVIENAFKHAYGALASGGELFVHTAVEEGYLHIRIEDNGDTLTDRDIEAMSARLAGARNHSQETTGLINVHRRVELMFGPGSGIVPSRSQLGGLCVSITFKL
ncbi:sensor histidine kinase [Paenibacillus chungangensis]|uniref:Sensor histidine kinase n=1 Tax=Paenibacillus chungangensis TaxID=696535 RepID=A0ABW3HNQ0_9BACL